MKTYFLAVLPCEIILYFQHGEGNLPTPAQALIKLPVDLWQMIYSMIINNTIR